MNLLEWLNKYNVAIARENVMWIFQMIIGVYYAQITFVNHSITTN